MNTNQPQKIASDAKTKCLCSYETSRADNFIRHLKRKTSWCDEVQVINTNKANDKEKIIIFYYYMINSEKSFVLWIRKIRRVNLEFINFVKIINNKNLVFLS